MFKDSGLCFLWILKMIYTELLTALGKQSPHLKKPKQLKIEQNDSEDFYISNERWLFEPSIPQSILKKNASFQQKY